MNIVLLIALLCTAPFCPPGHAVSTHGAPEPAPIHGRLTRREPKSVPRHWNAAVDAAGLVMQVRKEGTAQKAARASAKRRARHPPSYACTRRRGSPGLPCTGQDEEVVKSVPPSPPRAASESKEDAEEEGKAEQDVVGQRPAAPRAASSETDEIDPHVLSSEKATSENSTSENSTTDGVAQINPCPYGYERSQADLDSKTALPSRVFVSIAECAESCRLRYACSSFEYIVFAFGNRSTTGGNMTPGFCQTFNDGGKEVTQIIQLHGTLSCVKAGTDSSAAVVLFSTVIVGMMMLYLVHFPDDGVRLASWKTISSALSLVCALLCYQVVKDLVNLLTMDGTSEAVYTHGETVVEQQQLVGLRKAELDRLIAFARFGVWFVFMEFQLYNLRNNPLALSSAGILSAHACSFTCADAFATEQASKPWNESVAMAAAWAGITAVTVFSVAAFAYQVRLRVLREKTTSQEQELKWEAWERQCEWSENEFIGASTALVITQVIRFHLVGSIPDYGGLQIMDDTKAIWSLFAFAVGFGVASFALENAGFVQRWRATSELMDRGVGIVIVILAMTMGWCLLFWGQWWFWKRTRGKGLFGAGDQVAAMTVMAVMFNMIGFGSLIAIDKYGDWARQRLKEGKIRQVSSAVCLSEGFNLLMGLAWEFAIYEGIVEEVKIMGAKEESQKLLYTMALCGSFIVVVIPGWALYIVPNAIQAGDYGYEDWHSDSSGADGSNPPDGWGSGADGSNAPDGWGDEGDEGDEGWTRQSFADGGSIRALSSQGGLPSRRNSFEGATRQDAAPNEAGRAGSAAGSAAGFPRQLSAERLPQQQNIDL